jgi:hypothetical protein
MGAVLSVTALPGIAAIWASCFFTYSSVFSAIVWSLQTFSVPAQGCKKHWEGAGPSTAPRASFHLIETQGDGTLDQLT